MSDIVLAETERYERANLVMNLYVEGMSPAQISKKTGIKQAEVRSHIDEWRETVKANKFLQDRVDELLVVMDTHYSKLIQKAYDVVETVDSHLVGAEPKEAASLLGQKNTALKSIADFEGKRIDMLQKAGLLEAADLGDEYAKMEEHKQILMGILNEVVADCDRCRIEVTQRLAKITGETPVVDVE